MKRYVAAALRRLADGNTTEAEPVSQHETRDIHRKMPQQARATFRRQVKRLVQHRGKG